VPVFRGGRRRRQQAEEQDTHHQLHRGLHCVSSLNRKARTAGPVLQELKNMGHGRGLLRCVSSPAELRGLKGTVPASRRSHSG